MEPISSLTNTQLSDLITTWSGRIAAGEARLLALIAEFDRREAWGGPGLLSCAHWLVWKTGLSPGAAREKVRVARALADLPLVSEALAQGRVSFSQARAVTRVATPQDQVRWVELCRHTCAAQLEKAVRGVARVRQQELAEQDPELVRWRMRTTSSYDDAGNRRIVIVVPAQDAPVFDAALAQVQADLDRDRARQRPAPETGCQDEDPTTQDSAPPTPLPAGAEPPPRATLGDAVLELCRRTLDSVPSDRARRGRAQLTAQVDPVSGWARLVDGELLPPTALTGVSSLAKVMRGLPGRGGPPRLRPLSPADLARLDLGRTARLPNQALRDLLGTVDGERCRFPGCTRHRALHAHHVVHWADGGATDLSNLVLVCSRHHTLVHQQGFRLHLTPDRRLTVCTAEGVPVLHHPALPWSDPGGLDPDGDVSAETLVPDRVESRMDLGYVVMVLAQHAA